MTVAAILLLTVFLITCSLFTSQPITRCVRRKSMLKRRLPIRYYMARYHYSFEKMAQPKPIVLTQHLSTSTQPPTDTKQPDSIDISNRAIKCGTVAVDHFEPIIHGQNAAEKSNPWQAYVRREKSYCGGVLISSQWVLTAAHCIKNIRSIILGTNNIANLSSKSVVASSVKAIAHEGYNNFSDDIALIKLNVKIKFNDYIRPACLPEYSANFVHAKNCYVSGWGLTNFELGTRPDLLQEVNVDVIDNGNCFISWLLSGRILTSEHLCTAINLGEPQGTCNGDSGGPLSCLVGSSFYLAGVVIRVETECKKVRLPDLYIRVSFYRGWIERTMSNN